MQQFHAVVGRTPPLPPVLPPSQLTCQPQTASSPCQAKTPEARAAAVEAGFSRVVHSVDWAARHRFMSERDLRRWDRLVAWKAHDASEWE